MDFPATLVMSIVGLLTFGGFIVWAGIGDIRSFTITNQTNLLLAASFILLALPMGLGWEAVWDHVKIGLVTCLIATIMFYFGIFGGGDAKMAGAIALWLGSAPIIAFVFYTALAGGILGLILLIGRRLAKAYGLPKSPKWARRILRRQSAVPYGVALGVGALIAAPKAVWFPWVTLG
jgi:prepilin peptidase CpaA